MGEIPFFSWFSAISEIFVTIAVLYAVIRNLQGHRLNWKLLGLVLIFELCVNIVYMAGRASAADTSEHFSPAMKAFLAGHGILSLLMFLGLAIVFLLSVLDISSGRDTWFVRHRRLAWTFVFFWMVSVISGHTIFVIRYLA